MLATLLLPLPLDSTFTYHVPSNAEAAVGKRAVVPFGKRELTGFIIALEENRELPYEVKDIKRIIDKEAIFTKELIELSAWMSHMYLCSQGEALSIMIPSGRRESDNALFGEEEDAFHSIKELTNEQESAIETISKESGIYYLYGITGSGKSEVFLRQAERVIAKGKQVIYLVPEITLTHQLSEDVYTRFHSRVALLHSALTPSQRLKYWQKIINGEVDLIIGARSAVFAPCKDLGLIIMDEEHESSYKSGSTPRYHARQVAQKRAQMNGISLIMGSATPSMEAWQMMDEGRIKRLELKTRPAGGAEPQIDIVNVLKETRSISRYLEENIRQALYDKVGTILFLNRRGYTYYYHCNECGHVLECPNCSVALTYHKKENRMVCHYCGYSEKLVDKCPECGSTDMSVAGFGTEKVEEEVRKLFPSARIARLDTDVSSGEPKIVKSTLDEFKKGKIDILLGTQMVAKGLNFPSLRLVGVIMADSTLSIPDFRSEEHTFSLLKQVAGRCGRYRDDGHVIIQTCRVDDDAINAVKNNTTELFYKRELAIRKELGYPPFSRMVSLVARSKKEESAKEAALALGEVIKHIIDNLEKCEEAHLIGVQPCIIYRKATSYRYQILLAAKDVRLLTRIVKKALSLFKTPSSVYIEVDVDPLYLL